MRKKIYPFFHFAYRNRELLYILFLLIFSFAIRWYLIDKLPYGLEQDETSWGIVSLFQKFGIKGTSKGLWSPHDVLAKRFPVGIVINQLSFVLFGDNLISPRKMLVVVSVGVLASFYLLCRRFFKPFTSFIISLAYSFSVYKLITSRVAFPYMYSDLFLYITLILLTFIKKGQIVKNIIYMLLAGAGIILCLISYNLSFLIPLVVFIWLIYLLTKNKIGVSESIIILTVYFLFMIFIAPKTINDFFQERMRTDYVFGQSILLQNKNKNILPVIGANLRTIADMSFKRLTFDKGDMYVSYNGPLFLPEIIVLFFLGLVVCLIAFRRYFLILSWFVFMIAPIILCGLYFPRMWFLAMGSIYIIAGVGLEFINEKIYLLPRYLKYFFLMVIILLTFFYISKNIKLLFGPKGAIYNSAYRHDYREFHDMVGRHKDEVGKQQVIIDSDDELNTYYALLTFYALGKNDKIQKLKNMTAEDFNVLTPDIYREKYSKSFPDSIIVEKSYYPDILGGYKLKNYSKKEVGEYFIYLSK